MNPGEIYIKRWNDKIEQLVHIIEIKNNEIQWQILAQIPVDLPCPSPDTLYSSERFTVLGCILSDRPPRSCDLVPMEDLPLYVGWRVNSAFQKLLENL